MAPFLLFNVTCPPFDDNTTREPHDLGTDDLNALLYIVVTLLFYSMGIIVGIVTYIKREQADMQEDQVFDLYLSFKQEPFNMHKKERVQQMAVYLKQMEEAKLAREKIEAWSAEQTQKPLSSAATEVSHTVPAYGASLSFPGASGATVTAPTTDKAAHGAGASAILCSLTLGVCEPLLAPEGTLSKATAVSASANLPGFFPGSLKGKLRGPRHSVPAMTNPDLLVGKGIKRGNHRSCHEKRSGFVFPGKKRRDHQIELLDLKLARFNRDLPLFQDDSNDDFLSDDDDLDLELFKSNELDQSFPLPSRRDNENVPAFKRAAYASEKRKNKTIDPDQISFEKDSDYPDEKYSHVLSIAERGGDGDSRDLDSVENEACPIVITRNSSTSDLSVHSSCRMCEDEDILSDKSVNIDDINEPTVTLEPNNTEPEVLKKKHSLCEPLTLDKTLLRPFSDSAAAAAADSSSSSSSPTKPKLMTNSLIDIPRGTTPTDGRLSVHRTSVAPRFESWRKGGAKTVDIPDSKAALQHRSSSNLQHRSGKADNKQPQGRSRRGALLFTQKSLHHIENEEPKPGAARRVLGYQESTDSYSSRTTDSTDVGESPKLPPAFDRGRGQSSSGDVTEIPLSPRPDADNRRRGKRIPKLMRSKTVDSSKSPPL